VASNPQSWIDRSAVGLSGLCLAHCLIGSLVLVSMSSAVGLAFAHEIHVVGLLLAMPLAVVALVRGVRRHGKRRVVVFGGAGLCVMAAALAVGHGHIGEVVLTVIGVALLGVAHLMNLRYAR
jgi:uncharacterized membrane protein